jgi:pimeloyl-ACP methyl ester carboxylesterase
VFSDVSRLISEGHRWYCVVVLWHPLIMFPGLRFSNANPTGLARRFDPKVRLLSALARGGFTVYMVNRPPGLGAGTSMADIAADHARALEAEFERPVDILGISTGGSVALQLAADHPGILRRLVVVAWAYRLGQTGREVQRHTADFAARGQHRRALQASAPILVQSSLGQRLVGSLLWLAAPLAVGRGWDPSDVIATIKAEDAFDLGNRLGEITAPTLVIGAERDRAYSRDLLRVDPPRQ